jgi:hypothetical protein
MLNLLRADRGTLLILDDAGCFVSLNIAYTWGEPLSSKPNSLSRLCRHPYSIYSELSLPVFVLRAIQRGSIRLGVNVKYVLLAP